MGLGRAISSPGGRRATEQKLLLCGAHFFKRTPKALKIERHISPKVDRPQFAERLLVASKILRQTVSVPVVGSCSTLFRAPCLNQILEDPVEIENVICDHYSRGTKYTYPTGRECLRYLF